MRLAIKAKNGTVPEALKGAVEKRVKKLERYFRRLDSVEVTYSLVRGRHIVEINIDADSLALRSEDRCPDLTAAVDNAIEKMERQIIRFKNRVRDDHRKPVPTREPESESAAAPAEDEEFRPRIVRRKRYTMKPVSPEEAAGQMELLGHDFFLFRNVQTDEFNVLYRRQDGHYGLIEPDA
jgi:putative sigma-54 modulation protein